MLRLAGHGGRWRVMLFNLFNIVIFIGLVFTVVVLNAVDTRVREMYDTINKIWEVVKNDRSH